MVDTVTVKDVVGVWCALSWFVVDLGEPLSAELKNSCTGMSDKDTKNTSS